MWKSNFESGFRGWDWNSPGKQQGGKAYIISDPTNSEHGLVMKAEIGNGDKPTVLDWDFKWMVYRIYPFVSFPFKPAPCEIREDVWLSKDLLASVLDRGALVIGPDVFNKTDQYGGEWSSVIQAKIDHHSKHNSKIYLFLETHVGHYPIPVVDFPEFTPETWHTVSIFLNSDGHIQLRLNSQLVSETQLPSGQRIGTVGGHPGLYAGYRKNSLPLEGYMLIDNYEIRCW